MNAYVVFYEDLMCHKSPSFLILDCLRNPTALPMGCLFSWPGLRITS